jgi:hypothetical protein
VIERLKETEGVAFGFKVVGKLFNEEQRLGQCPVERARTLFVGAAVSLNQADRRFVQ